MTGILPYFQTYQSSNGQWYWRLRDGNHKTIADGSEGYYSHENVVRAINNVVDAVKNSDNKIH